jgi:hypothetical protein
MSKAEPRYADKSGELDIIPNANSSSEYESGSSSSDSLRTGRRRNRKAAKRKGDLRLPHLEIQEYILQPWKGSDPLHHVQYVGERLVIEALTLEQLHLLISRTGFMYI